jgi:DNA-directed RNA polymerase subunit beta
VCCASHGEVDYVTSDGVDYMDVSPRQMVSRRTAMIPFLEHDDANRASWREHAAPACRWSGPRRARGME